MVAFGFSRLMKWSWIGLFVLLIAGFSFWINQNIDINTCIEAFGIEQKDRELDEEFFTRMTEIHDWVMNVVFRVGAVSLLVLVGYLIWVLKYFYPSGLRLSN